MHVGGYNLSIINMKRLYLMMLSHVEAMKKQAFCLKMEAGPKHDWKYHSGFCHLFFMHVSGISGILRYTYQNVS